MSKYPYSLFPPKDKPVLKPYIYIRLGCKKTHKIIPNPVLALIDSGADMCLCKKYIGDWLGLNFNKLKRGEITAVNKTRFVVLIHPLTVFFQNKIYEASFSLSDEIPDQTPIILGQKGFFDHFKITFDLPNKEIEIV